MAAIYQDQEIYKEIEGLWSKIEAEIENAKLLREAFNALEIKLKPLMDERGRALVQKSKKEREWQAQILEWFHSNERLCFQKYMATDGNGKFMSIWEEEDHWNDEKALQDTYIAAKAIRIDISNLDTIVEDLTFKIKSLCSKPETRWPSSDTFEIAKLGAELPKRLEDRQHSELRWHQISNQSATKLSSLFDKWELLKTITNEFKTKYEQSAVRSARQLTQFSCVREGSTEDARIMCHVGEEVAKALGEQIPEALGERRNAHSIIRRLGISVRETYLEARKGPEVLKDADIIATGFAAVQCADVVSDAALLETYNSFSYRNISTTYSRKRHENYKATFLSLYGFKSPIVWRFRHCRKFINLLNAYASVKSWHPNNFESTKFYECWQIWAPGFYRVFGNATSLEEANTHWDYDDDGNTKATGSETQEVEDYFKKDEKRTERLKLEALYLEEREKKITLHHGAKVDRYDDATKDRQIESLKYTVEARDRIIKSLELRVSEMEPCYEIGWDIRSRHMELEKANRDVDWDTVDLGNSAAHDGAPLADASILLFDNRKGDRCREGSYIRCYGVPPKVVWEHRYFRNFQWVVQQRANMAHWKLEGSTAVDAAAKFLAIAEAFIHQVYPEGYIKSDSDVQKDVTLRHLLDWLQKAVPDAMARHRKLRKDLKLKTSCGGLHYYY